MSQWDIVEQDAVPGLIYAVGDVHGCLDLLNALEDKITADAAAHDENPVIIMLGDYIDRGDNSRGILEHLSLPPASGTSRICLAGNHEEMFLRFLEKPAQNASWLDFGGVETLLSYGVNPKLFAESKLKGKALRYELDALIPHEHTHFLKGLHLLIRTGDLVFVHAGIMRDISIDAQLQKDVLWMRSQPDDDHPPYVVVHGHTPHQEVFKSLQRYCVDTGAYQSGKLSAVKFLNGEYISTLTT